MHRPYSLTQNPHLNDLRYTDKESRLFACWLLNIPANRNPVGWICSYTGATLLRKLQFNIVTSSSHRISPVNSMLGTRSTSPSSDPIHRPSGWVVWDGFPQTILQKLQFNVVTSTSHSISSAQSMLGTRSTSPSSDPIYRPPGRVVWDGFPQTILQKLQFNVVTSTSHSISSAQSMLGTRSTSPSSDPIHRPSGRVVRDGFPQTLVQHSYRSCSLTLSPHPVTVSHLLTVCWALGQPVPALIPYTSHLAG